MLKKLNLLLRISTLVLMGAFFLRPVVVCAHNSILAAQVPARGLLSLCSPEPSAPQWTLRIVNKESPNVVFPATLSKRDAPWTGVDLFETKTDPVLPSPGRFLILRI